MNVSKRGNFTFDDLVIGELFHNRYTISEDVYCKFVNLFGDASPLHVDDATAVRCGFQAKLMHGAILNGFISNFVGMHFPGKRTLELAVDMNFDKPTYVGDELELHAVVKERLESRKVVVLRFRFLRGREMVAHGKVSIMMCDL